MENYKILHLSKQGSYWRMKKEDGICFIDDICRHFNKSDHLQSLEYDKVLYVEVNIQNLFSFENLFDKYFLSSDYFLMVLSGFGKFISCGKSLLNFRLCIEQDGIPVILDCKLAKKQNDFSKQMRFNNAF